MRTFLTIILAASCIAFADAQAYLQQSGNLFDANPQVGSGGTNAYRRPVSPLSVSNSVATGNVRYGQSFRGSTISDPTAFRGRLGSSTLSNFRRDSFGAIDQSRFTGGLGSGFNQIYYDRSSTVATAGYLRGVTSPSSQSLGSQSRQLRPFLGNDSARIDSRIQAGYRPPNDSGITRDASTPLGTPSVTSSIFRYDRPQNRGIEITSPLNNQLDNPIQDALGSPAWVRQPGYQRPSVQDVLGDTSARSDRMGALLGEKPANSLLGSTRLNERLDETALRPRLLTSVQPLPEPELNPSSVPIYPTRSTTETADSGMPAVPVDPSALPGHDLFSDMRLVLEVSRNPEADWYQQMRESAMASSVIEGRQLELASQEANEFVERMLNTPLASLVGEGRTNANNELLKAESLMEIGHYYEAAQRYDAAAAIEPLNPIPLIGQTNAFLAAGEYNSAAHALVRAIDRFPQLARFRLDLKSLLGGGEIVDIRRADLMSRAEESDDPRLLLLLGYLEINTGLTELGKANLSRAAEQAGPGSLIERYYQAISEREDGAAPAVLTPPAPRKLQDTKRLGEEQPREPQHLIVPPNPDE